MNTAVGKRSCPRLHVADTALTSVAPCETRRGRNSYRSMCIDGGCTLRNQVGFHTLDPPAGITRLSNSQKIYAERAKQN